jgi:hypothetical protein
MSIILYNSNKYLCQRLLRHTTVNSALVMCFFGMFGCSATHEASEVTTSANQQVASAEPYVRQVQQGDMAHHSGTPTIRKPFAPQPDDPSTTNNEANDQPIGHFGSVTLNVHNVSSGNSYPLDADVDGTEVQRLYFPKGGWVDFNSSELDSSGNGSGIDEQGRSWEFEGFADGTAIQSASSEEPEANDE